MGERLVKDPQNYGSYLFWIPRPDNDVAEMEKVTEMGKFVVKSSQGRMLSHVHANLMLHTIDCYIREHDLELNKIIEFTSYDLAVNGLGYNYLNLGYNSTKNDDLIENREDGKKGINRYLFEKLKDIREISIYFHGKFYEESKITKKSYGVFNYVDMDEGTGKVKIQFNEIFTKQLKATKDYVMLDIEEFRMLRPKTAILYQYAVENTQNKTVEKNIRELCEGELHWANQKPGKLYKDFKESADEIMEKTDKVLEHKYSEENKMVKFKISNKISRIDEFVNNEIKEIYTQCPDLLKDHPRIIKTISSFYDNYNLKNNQKKNGYSWGYLVVMANVMYVKEKLNNNKIDRKKSWNYFLACLEKNHGDSFIPIILQDNDKEKNKNKIDILINENEKKREEETKKLEHYLDNVYSGLADEMKKNIEEKTRFQADLDNLFSRDSEYYNSYYEMCRRNVMKSLGYHLPK